MPQHRLTDFAFTAPLSEGELLSTLGSNSVLLMSPSSLLCFQLVSFRLLIANLQ